MATTIDAPNFWQLRDSPRIPRNTDLNSLVSSGSWTCDNFKVGVTLQNLPFKKGPSDVTSFILINSKIGTTKTGVDTLLQLLLPIFGGIYMRCYMGWKKTWSPWMYLPDESFLSPKEIANNNDLTFDATLPGTHYKNEGIALPGNKNLYSESEKVLLDAATNSVAVVDVKDVFGTYFWNATFNYNGIPITLRACHNKKLSSETCKWYVEDSTILTKGSISITFSNAPATPINLTVSLFNNGTLVDSTTVLSNENVVFNNLNEGNTYKIMVMGQDSVNSYDYTEEDISILKLKTTPIFARLNAIQTYLVDAEIIG